MIKTVRRRGAWFAATLVVGALLPSPAFAAGGLSDATFQTILFLLGVIGVAYLITHFASEWIQDRYGVVTGVEYMVLGALMAVMGLIDAKALEQLTPALVLGTGSLGLLAGLHLNLRRFDELDIEAVRIGLWVTLGTVVTMVALPMLVMALALDSRTALAWLPGLLCAGAVAQVGDPRLLLSLRQFLNARGEATDMATRVARICSSLAVISFGLLFCLNDRQTIVVGDDRFAALEWFGVHLVLGIILGVVFAIFLRREFEGEKVLTVVVGMVIFTSGLAYYLKLSPIFVSFILGLILINAPGSTSRRGEAVMEPEALDTMGSGAPAVRALLEAIERPLYIVLFFFAGANLSFKVPWWAYVAVIPYVLLRNMGRFGGGLIATRTSALEPRVPHLGRVLLAPGGLSVALLLDFHDIYGRQQHSPTVYTAVLIAILVSEIVSYRRTRSWMIDHMDVPTPKIQRAMRGQELEVT